MSYLLPSYSGDAPNLVKDPDPIVTVSGQRIRITKVHPTEGITFDKLGAAPAEDQPETVIESSCGCIGGTFEDLAAVVAHLENPPVPEPTVEQAWADYLAGYFTDPVTSIQLKTSIAACNRFAAMETLLKSGLEHGLILELSPVEVWDRHNVAHALTVAECRALLLRYGFAWQSAFNALAP